MFRKFSRQVALLAIFSICITTNVLPHKTRNLSESKPNKTQKENANVTRENGLTKIDLSLKEGNIEINLPDDMTAGDTISGTVLINPKGKNDSEKQKNLKKINELKLQPMSTRITWVFPELPGMSTNAVALGSLPNADSNFNQTSVENEKLNQTLRRAVRFSLNNDQATNEKVGLKITNQKGKEISQAEISVFSEELEITENSEYEIPDIGQTGRPVNMLGDFDGDLTNTICEIGNKATQPLAESPRKTVFESPMDVIGKTEIKLKEGNTEIQQDFRNLGISLSAGKLNLLKGETTNLLVKVSGLQDLTDEIPLNLNCTGSANMSGGNVQNLQISPSEVQTDGSFTQERNLVGFRTGNFNVKANVIVNARPKNLRNEVVHVEKDPVNIGDENDKVWWLKVKLSGGQIIDIYIKQDFKPNLKFCDWIEIKETKKDPIDDEIVTNYQKVDDPTKPCTLTNQIVHVEGNPLKLPNGSWQVKVKTLDGKIIYIYLQSPDKPDLKFCKWIKLHKCKKLKSNIFTVDGYDVAEDPNKKPPVAVVTPTPTPTPTPKPTPPPVASVKPCKDGDIRNKKVITKTFEILEKDSKLSFSIETNNGSGGVAAEGMAAWLKGIASIGGELSDNLPEEAVVGNAVAGAVLKYVELGGDIIGALAKSNLRNLNVSKVVGKLSGEVTKVTAVCTSYEICVNGAWVKQTDYSETREKTYYSKTKTVEPKDNAWDKVTVTSRPQSFDPDKAEKYLMEELLKDLKKNEDDYKKFKDDCK